MQSYRDNESRLKKNSQITKRKIHKYKKLKSLLLTRYILDLQGNRLLDAINVNNTDRVEALLKGGINPNMKDPHSRSALHVACSKNFIDIVQLLLQFGANPNIKDVLHNTPLHLATCTSNINIVKILIQAGADAKISDIHGRNPVQLAESKFQILTNAWKNPTVKLKPQLTQIQQVMHFFL